MMFRASALVLCAALVVACGDDDNQSNQNNQNQNQNNNNNAAIECGNGVLETGEACDDGAANSDTEADACRSDCREAHCGDGVKDTPEACDDGDDGNNGSDACPDTCLAPVCGDGHLHAGVEVCDDGNTDDGDDCRGDCLQDMTQCGDGADDPGEQCDDGSANSDSTPNACRQDCQLPVCGDGVADTSATYGEQCDGSDLGGGTCATYNLDGGPLTCDASCMHVRTQCYGCGNDICEWTSGESDQPSAAGYCPGDCLETDCDDSQDNDGDQLTDCDDANCDGLTCAPHGMECDGGACECSGNGGTVQSAETEIDGFDNDCDGLVDCDDPDADGVSCGVNGEVCDINATGNRCICGGNGAPPEATESTCDDGIDNDCDGDQDCIDSDCDTQACDANGSTCTGFSCNCTGNGGTVEAPETTCNDEADNDCNGAMDCEEAACRNETIPVACKPYPGWKCTLDCPFTGSCHVSMRTWDCRCTANPVLTAESDGAPTSCGDGEDNDCDGTVDCDDTDCQNQACDTGKMCRTDGMYPVVWNCVLDSCWDGPEGATEDYDISNPATSSCGDGNDSDCDGATDCADIDCLGKACDTGKICQNAVMPPYTVVCR